MKYTTLAILAGFLLDQLFGDPYWLPHPIRAIGWLISKGETWIRGILPKTPMGEKTGGFFLEPANAEGKALSMASDGTLTLQVKNTSDSKQKF